MADPSGDHRKPSVGGRPQGKCFIFCSSVARSSADHHLDHQHVRPSYAADPYKRRSRGGVCQRNQLSVASRRFDQGPLAREQKLGASPAPCASQNRRSAHRRRPLGGKSCGYCQVSRGFGRGAVLQSAVRLICRFRSHPSRPPVS
jgi:hypothetical protein